MEKKKKATRRAPGMAVGSKEWWEQRLAQVRGGNNFVVKVRGPRRSDDDTTEDDSTCCDLDSSTDYTWGRR